MTKNLVLRSITAIIATTLLSGCGEEIQGETQGHIGGLGASVIEGLQILNSEDSQE